VNRRVAFLLLIALFLAIVPLLHHHGLATDTESREHEAACVLTILGKSAAPDVAVPVVADAAPDGASRATESIAAPASADVFAFSSPRAPPSFSI
jgi:hypothetical protein